MRQLLIVLPLLLAPMAPSQAQVSIDIGMPGINIGINVPVFPDLVPVPGYPVYYDPDAPTNYFFYDGLYWVFQGDNWYQSSWYNGPWVMVQPVYVPVFLLRVPVRYYRYPPHYFHGWRYDEPPRWGDHWGRDWEDRRHGWDHWDRHAIPAAAPLPLYQRQYSGERYPRSIEQQHSIRSQNYHYQPREAITRQSTQPPGHEYHPAPEQQRQPSPQYAPPQRYPQPGRPANEPYQPVPAPQRPQPPQQPMPPNQPWQQQVNPGRVPEEQRSPNRPQYQERNPDGEHGDHRMDRGNQRPPEDQGRQEDDHRGY